MGPYLYGMSDNMDDMEELDRTVITLWVLLGSISAVIATAVAGGAAFYLALPFVPIAGGAFVLLMLVNAAYQLRRYQIWRFSVDDDALYLKRGVITRRKSVVPFSRIQHVDTNRNPWERLFGLASVVVYTAGSRGSDAVIPGLRPERAEELQSSLRRQANRFRGADTV